VVTSASSCAGKTHNVQQLSAEISKVTSASWSRLRSLKGSLRLLGRRIPAGPPPELQQDASHQPHRAVCKSPSGGAVRMSSCVTAPPVESELLLLELVLSWSPEAAEASAEAVLAPKFDQLFPTSLALPPDVMFGLFPLKTCGEGGGIGGGGLSYCSWKAFQLPFILANLTSFGASSCRAASPRERVGRTDDPLALDGRTFSEERLQVEEGAVEVRPSPSGGLSGIASNGVHPGEWDPRWPLDFEAEEVWCTEADPGLDDLCDTCPELLWDTWPELLCETACATSPPPLARCETAPPLGDVLTVNVRLASDCTSLGHLSDSERKLEDSS